MISCLRYNAAVLWQPETKIETDNEGYSHHYNKVIHSHKYIFLSGYKKRNPTV